MNRRWRVFSVPVAAVIGMFAGLASGLFLESLSLVTRIQTEHSWLLFALPAAGAIVAGLYARYGSSAAGGTNLILDELHLEPSPGVPFRMLPLILSTTLLTHLFGGSAGREGTAVQMGGSLAAEASRRLRLDDSQRRLIILCGISGGFSGVFGTPFAAAIFAIEAPAIGRLRISALAHCFVAAVCAHLTVQLLSVEHAHYAIASRMPGISLIVLVKILIAAVAFGLAAAAFVELTRAIERVGHRFAANPIARASLGGVVIVAVTIALGTREYNGLSLPMLARSLSGSDVPDLAFMIKLGLTALTLGVGFKGGEVTPLFVIGATLGVTLSGPLNLPSDALAAIGFVSVFAAASNTPVACVIMAIELFGADGTLFYAVSIAIAYVASGHRGIYASQRMHRSKVGVRLLDANMTLRDAPPLAVRALATEVVRRIRVR